MGFIRTEGIPVSRTAAQRVLNISTFKIAERHDTRNHLGNAVNIHIDLTFIIASIPFTLRKQDRRHITRSKILVRIKITGTDRLRVLNAKLITNARDSIDHKAVNLLTVIGRFFAVPVSETVPIISICTRHQGLSKLDCLRPPGNTAFAGNLI